MSRTDVLLTATQGSRVRFRAYSIEVIEGPDAGKSVRLERGSLLVGSAPDADLVLKDGSVSRTHARLVAFPDGVEVTDLDSKNGVFSAGTRITKARVPPGAELGFGRTKVRIVPEDQEQELPPSDHTHFGFVHGRSLAMRELFAVLERVAAAEAPVLVAGEPGVGKERVARALHAASPHPAEALLVLEAARGFDPKEVPSTIATLIVRHVDALGPEEQAELTRVVQSGAPRVIATTGQDLDKLARAGRFDRGLLVALGAIRVRVPPLRERASDLPLLIERILAEQGHGAIELGPADLGRMQAYAWPDNVRELVAVIQRAVLLGAPSFDPGPTATDQVIGADLPYKQARAQMIEAFEREYVRALLSHHDGNVSAAARAAGIDRVYLHRLIKKYEL